MNSVPVELDNSNSGPADRIKTREFADGVMKAGSLISMLENKKLNITALFVLLLESTKYQDFFTEITSSDTFKQAILSLLQLHPTLVKSKFTKAIVRKANAKKQPDRIRKITVQ
jgi:hypothetical protein